MKLLFELFIAFFKISICTFGGGYAMMPMVQKEVIEKRSWATEAEVMDYYAISQVTPGVIGVNTSTFVGCHVGGAVGGVFATLGFIAPSIILVSIIAALLQNFTDYAVVQNAFAGIRACVFVLVLNATIKMWKSAIVDRITLVMCLVVMACTIILGTSPVILVLVCGAAGLVITGVKARKQTDIAAVSTKSDDASEANAPDDSDDSKGGDLQ